MDLKKLLREGLLNEGKPFGKNSYVPKFKKLGIEINDKVKNGFTLFGVYRDMLNFNMSEINSISDMQTYYDKFIDIVAIELADKNVKGNRYYDNLDLAKKHVKLYADNFLKNIYPQKGFQPISIKKGLKSIKKTFIDVVYSFNKNTYKELDNVISIENPDGGDVLLNNDDLTIVRGSSKSKCIRYGQGEKWCISQAQANMYNSYRIRDEATMYFVLDKTTKVKLANVKDDENGEKKDKIKAEEKLVIMVYPDGYAIADKTNDGKRTGSRSKTKSWDEIVEELPILKGHQDKFKKVKVSDSEIKYHEIVSKEYEGKDEEFQKYINTTIEGLEVNDEKVSDREFIVEYIASGNEISVGQFESLDERPKGPREGVIEAGYFTYENYDGYGLSKTEITRVIKLKVKSGQDLTPKEFVSLDDSTRSEAIDNGCFMYADTGDYPLTDEELRRVVKLKVKNRGSIFPKEFNVLDTPTRSELIDNGYFENMVIDNYPLTDEELRRVIELKVKNRGYLSPKDFDLLDTPTRSEVINRGYFKIKNYYDYNFTDEEISKVIKVRIKSGNLVSTEEFDLLDTSDRSEVIDSGYFNGENYNNYSLTDEEIRRVIVLKVKNKRYIPPKEFVLLDTPSRSVVIDSGYFNINPFSKHLSRYNLTDEEIRRIETRKGEPVNESINMMKRMNLL